MNCDTAFDLMTDPHGSRSASLAEHFETCTRCRQMQETLAPALDFLMQDESPPSHGATARDVCGSQEESRQPLITIDAVRIAQQAAGRLAAQADLPRVRRQRLAGHALRYAGVFAAGLLVALVLAPNRQVKQSIPAGDCTRQEAASGSSGRSPDVIQVLARSCALCHAPVPATRADNQTSLLRSNRAPTWEWLAPFFSDEYRPLDDSRFVAGSTSSCLHIAADRLS